VFGKNFHGLREDLGGKKLYEVTRPGGSEISDPP